MQATVQSEPNQTGFITAWGAAAPPATSRAAPRPSPSRGATESDVLSLRAARRGQRRLGAHTQPSARGEEEIRCRGACSKPAKIGVPLSTDFDTCHAEGPDHGMFGWSHETQASWRPSGDRRGAA